MTNDSPPRPASPGQMPLADRYRVLARVGVGGTAVVYRCVDLHTERVVAVKVLRSSGPLIPDAAARFRREAHLAATLTHSHIVRVLDYGYTIPLAAPTRAPWIDDSDQPVPYLAMEYVFGSSLKEILRRLGPMPLDWVWTIGEQLCDALATAHAEGVVHRDVKPQNVMIVDSRIELLSKLADFGIARQVGGDLTTLTVTGQVLGTPDYLSPEQVMGEPGGPASDLYALGVVLFELITGRLPFAAETPLAAASRRMVADPPLLSAYRPDVPPELQEVVLLALRREAEERFADALEFAQALRWSRERAPSYPRGEPGAWVLENSRRPPMPPVEQRPIEDPKSPSATDEDHQSTVLRVSPGVASDEPPTVRDITEPGVSAEAAPPADVEFPMDSRDPPPEGDPLV